MFYRLGVDVGGTNTDAVILDENYQLMGSIKAPTTLDVTTGIFNAIEGVLKSTSIDKSKIKFAMLGTTHCTNAIVERKNLSKVGIIRIGAPATLSIKPMIDWPEDLVEAINKESYIVKGGIEYDGKEISPVDEEEIREVARKMKGNVDTIAITCVFSQIRFDHEIMVSQIIKEELGDILISMSHEVANMGLIERENATILNSALIEVARNVTEGFRNGLERQGIKNAQIYLCQNDGTLMSMEYAKKFPILTVACGPTNSIRGASFLSKERDAIIMDIGGTTTDIGVIVKQFPRESSQATEVGGVRTNFRMPDILAIGLGGGTIITEKDGEIKIGPGSVGYRLTEEALVFGGDILTATDIAVRLGEAKLGDPSLVEHIDLDFANKVMDKMMEKLEDGIDKMKLSSEDAKVVLVGGGGVIVKDKLKGVSELIKPDHYPVANAIGSAISQVSGTFEKLFNLEELSREEALKIGKAEAMEDAILAGAKKDTIEIVDVEDIPLSYHPGNVARIKIKAVGEL